MPLLIRLKRQNSKLKSWLIWNVKISLITKQCLVAPTEQTSIKTVGIYKFDGNGHKSKSD